MKKNFLIILVAFFCTATYGLSQDIDGDGYLSYADGGIDCDDNDPNVNPAATEICDGIDNNCDGQIDEGLNFDVDGDGFNSLNSCSNATDCDDNDPNVNPAATELCDGLDNNCNTQIDEGLNFDADGDGFNSLSSCSNATDCDDNDPNINPITPIDSTVSVSGITLTANASGYAYNWVDCNNSNASLGVITQNYTPIVNGSYAVEIDNGTCVVISTCINVTTVGIDEKSKEYIRVYPNPSTNRMFTVRYVGNINHIKVLDILGRVISIPIDYESGIVDGSSLDPGKYFISIETDNSVVTKEIVMAN